MSPHLKDIYAAFGGKLVGSFQMKTHVCEVVAKMPSDIIQYVTAKVWFMGSLDDAWAFTFREMILKICILFF